MGQASADFLPNVIALLRRLQEQSVEQNESMLAFLLDLARTEAEDRLRQDGLDAEMRLALQATSTVGFLASRQAEPPRPPTRRKKPLSGAAGRGPRRTA